jgi:poly(A) polymerase
MMGMSKHLPLDGWMGRDDLAALVAALGAGNLRWVGGARDTLLGIDVKDIDAATPLHPPAVIEPARRRVCARCPRDRPWHGDGDDARRPGGGDNPAP